jgi:hypothetical protein
MSNVAINILAEFVGKKAFRDAQRSVSSLEKSVVKLGRGLGLALGTTAIAAFGKTSLKAFAADEAAAQRLATAVDNLGLSYSQVRVSDFISQTEKSAGILDDSLRPAMQALLTTTGSLTKSQELLNNAIQISRGTGIDLATVSQDLANGYVGITKGLKKYNTGLTQSELQSKSFADVLGILLANSAGAAQAYLTTTSYKMDVLRVATENAKETIGKGLVDAFARIGGGTEASDAAKSIDNIAKAVSSVVIALGTGIGLIEKFRKAYTNFLAGGDIDNIRAGAKPSTNRSASPAGTAKRFAQQRLAEAAAAKRAKELAALQAKQVKAQKELTAEQKKQAALKKAAGVFDIEQANLIAALTRNITKEEELRAKAQLALLNNNEVVATALTKQILLSQDATGNLYKLWLTLPDAKNPFQYLEGYLDMLKGKIATTFTLDPSTLPPELRKDAPIIVVPDTNASVGAFPKSQPGDFRRAEEASNRTGPIQVVVQIDGKEIASSNQSQSLSGTPSSLSRVSGMFGG